MLLGVKIYKFAFGQFCLNTRPLESVEQRKEFQILRQVVMEAAVGVETVKLVSFIERITSEKYCVS